MSDQNAAISRSVERVAEDFKAMGFEIDRGEIARCIGTSDVTEHKDCSHWVEAADHAPGGNTYPYIVYCSLSDEPGAATVKSYEPVSNSNA